MYRRPLLTAGGPTLKTATDLLVADLEEMVGSWDAGGAAREGLGP